MEGGWASCGSLLRLARPACFPPPGIVETGPGGLSPQAADGGVSQPQGTVSPRTWRFSAARPACEDRLILQPPARGPRNPCGAPRSWEQTSVATRRSHSCRCPVQPHLEAWARGRQINLVSNASACGSFDSCLSLVPEVLAGTGGCLCLGSGHLAGGKRSFLVRAQ